MLGEALSLGCALAWGVSVILFKRSEKASPYAINLFKNSAAFLLLGLTLLGLTLTGQAAGLPTERSPEDWVRVIVSGVVGLAVADTLFLEALRRLGAGMMAILDCVYAPLVAILSVLFLGEHLGPGFALGTALVVGGLLAATTTGEGLKAAAAVARTQFGSVLLGVSSIALMAVGVVIAKPVLDRSELVEVTFTRMGAGSLSLAIWVLLRRPDRSQIFSVFLPQPVWRQLVPAMLLGTYVSMLLWLGGVKYTSASTASVLNQLSVLFTLVLAKVVLREPMSVRRMVGGGCSLAGAVVILLAAG
ncbi:MAG: DMT family transporter [Deltaproteobacteria bacterium]|nr:DMT family transporter [Deltaproteobacteria bacterium]